VKLVRRHTGCAQKETATAITEKDRAAFKGGPMPESARQQMARWIQRNQANQKKAGNGPTAADTAAMK